MSDYSLGCKLPAEEWAWLNRSAVSRIPGLRQYIAPFPPAKLMENTSGLTGEEEFASQGADFWIALSNVSEKHLSRYESILDFGCGCGRLARMFKGYTGYLAGCDVDPRHIRWCSEYLDFMDARLSYVDRPVPFADDAFGAVISISVFTHLDEKCQDTFLKELNRVCRRDAILFITVHGKRAMECAVSDQQTKNLLQMDEELFRAAKNKFGHGEHAFVLQYGHLTTSFKNGKRNPGAVISEPYQYGIAFIPEEYLNRHWTQWFDILGYHPAAIHDFQDIIVLRPRKT